MNEPIGRLRIAQPGARTANRIGHPRQRLILPDHALAQPVFHLHQLLHFAFQHLRDRNARPLRDDLRDIFFVDLFLQHARCRLLVLDLLPSSFAQSRLPVCGSSPYRISAARSQIAFALRPSALPASAARSFLQLAHPRRSLSFSCFQRSFQAAGLLLASRASSFSTDSSRSCEFGVLLLLQRLPLDLQLRGPALQLVDLRSASNRSGCQRGGASSTRSIALSGRKRSEM